MPADAESVRLRAVLDPNVLISASTTSTGGTGAPVRLVQAAAQRRFTLVVSPRLLAELDEVLRRERFRRYASIERVEAFVAALRGYAEVATDPARVPTVTRDPDDDYLVALARDAGVDALVSGDRDLTDLALADLLTLTPRAFLDRLDKDRPGEHRPDE